MNKKNSITFLLLLLTLFILFGCTTTKEPLSADKETSSNHKETPYSFEGGDGRTIENAVIIKGGPDCNSFDAIAAEEYWIRKNHPGWKKGSQALITEGDRMYDVIMYETPEGKVEIYYDITDCFGF